MFLKVSPKDARRRLEAIQNIHKKYREALTHHWRDPHASGAAVDPRSVCWLFCWAKSGLNSTYARDEARRVFNQIFDKSYEELVWNLGEDALYQYAQVHRGRLRE